MASKVSPIIRYAQSLGFDEVGVTSPSVVKNSGKGLENFVALGRHGDMSWMERNIDRRSDPTSLWPDVRSVIVVAANYGPDVNPLDALLKKNTGAISVYAQNRDYHKVLKGRLKQLGSWVGANYGGQLKVFVDTAPVMEKPLAQAAGIGWQGKHTNLVSKQFGSWLFLGVLFTSLSLTPNDRAGDTCGSCRSCLDVCPTQAFPKPHQIDARRCISYLTIEHKGIIDREFRRPIGNRIFGCDDCLAVCPWNKFAQQTKELQFVARDDLQEPLLSVLVSLDEERFRSYFSQSPVKRIGRDRFIRNVLIAIGNSGNPNFIEAVENKLWDKSKIVRATAVWALANLVLPHDFVRYRNQHYSDEVDFDVRNEWDEVGIV
jgi:epoxyqueuosine reductase